MFLSNHARNYLLITISLGLLWAPSPANAQQNLRRVESLNANWKTYAVEDPGTAPAQIEAKHFDDRHWKETDVPHNWDRYEGFRQAKHGNFHGSAWYRRTFTLQPSDQDRQIFLFFEGVGSYATVWVNGKIAGTHAGGLTTFTLDITQLVQHRGENVLVVRADHPSGIRDLPWVCGGCELAYGFSEGTQPFGISRPVSLIVTDSLRFAPFGIHAWNDDTMTAEGAILNVGSEITNYGERERHFILRTTLIDPSGRAVYETEQSQALNPGQTTTIAHTSPTISNPDLWSPKHPNLHTIVSEIVENGVCVDRITTPYGFRWIEWPKLDGPPEQPLLINGEAVFVNGVADYEHVLGESHAFSDQQIKTRVEQIQAAGFNAFRDAHHPHNLRFNAYWDREGMLWWTQFGAHIWFENEAFKDNYKQLLRDWIKERRNSPSLFLYGLQNESKLPVDFVEECLEIIRELDPTASTQRLITTCNGGKGTDWDVPQNWSGTYGGDLNAYDSELRAQRLVGEYGAWRSLGLHSEGGFIEDGPLSEDRMAALMETKVRLAEKTRGKAIGHFAWPFVTHQNPGRNVGSNGQQSYDGIRLIDRIGPANNKGLLSIWGEPLDVYYMYRSNYAAPKTEPMVYIVSQTWPDRWTKPGLKDGIIVYSNCDEVELFNDHRQASLGTRTRNGKGTHFRWDGVPVHWNTLYAEGRIDGKVVATDTILLNHLPQAPAQQALNLSETAITEAIPGHYYLYRVNAGGPAYTDVHGQHWSADRAREPGMNWGSLSWNDRFPNLPDFFGSKRRIHKPIRQTADDELFQCFRYGRDELKYRFDVPNGNYTVELYFIEPWYGTGGGADCSGWRSFDVAINGQPYLRNLDIWREVGTATALRKQINCSVTNGMIEVSFPRTHSWQGVISAIAISSPEKKQPLPDTPHSLVQTLQIADVAASMPFNLRTWLDTGTSRTSDGNDSFSFIPWELREAEWIQVPDAAARLKPKTLISFSLAKDATVHIAHPDTDTLPRWLKSWSPSGEHILTKNLPPSGFKLYYKHLNAGETVRLGPAGNTMSNAMYSIIVTERSAPPPPNGIVEFSVRGTNGIHGWQPSGNLRAGRGLYANDAAPIGSFSSRLSDADWIRTDPSDADNPNLSVQFRYKDHVEVFVALDPKVETLPAWLTDWIPTSWHITTDKPHDKRYQLRWKRFAPNEQIELGPNGVSPSSEPAEMYTVILRTVKPDQRFEAEQLLKYAALRNTSLQDFTGQGYLDLASLDEAYFDWQIQVGVGDRYNLNMRYLSSAEDAIPAKVTIIADDGTIVCTDETSFQPTQHNAWSLLRYRTCDSINAGTYRIRLHANDFSHLKFDSVTVE